MEAYENSTIKLRFRFVSNCDSLGGEGWYIDSLAVVTSPTAVWISSLSATEADGCVMLSWRAAEELRRAPFSVWRSPGPDGAQEAEIINEEPVVSERTYEFRDCRVEADNEYRYWVGVEGSSGLFYGPVTIRVSGETLGAPRLELASANPATSLLKLLLRLPRRGVGGEVSLVVFDVSGRAVKTLYSSRNAGGDEPIQVEWDMKDYSGKRVSSGVYFLKLQWPRGVLTTKVVVLATSGRF